MNSLMIWTHGCQLFIYQRRKKKNFPIPRVYSLLLVFFFFGGLIAEMPVMARPQTRAFISYVPSYVWTLSISQNFVAIPKSRHAFREPTKHIPGLALNCTLLPLRSLEDRTSSQCSLWLHV
jgi:hypothetical protein